MDTLHLVTRGFAALLGLTMATLAAVAQPGGDAPDHPELSDLPLNRIQVIGTHNSYKKLIQPELFEALLKRDPGVEGLDYGHRPLDEQLDLGLRNLELDVYWDPDGGRYRVPLGLRTLRAFGVEPWPFATDGELDEPGLKVMHDCNIDYRSHHLRFEDTLAVLRAWSATNPRHLPVFVTMNLKAGEPPMPGASVPAPWDDAALERLDRDLTTHLGRYNLLTPDDVRGDAASVMAAIMVGGWPAVEACRGKFVFIIDHGGDIARDYLRLRPNLENAALFTVWPESAPTTAIRIMNDPRGPENQRAIREVVATGRIVRTRADAGTKEMRASDLSRYEAAKASGAQVITTDYPYPDERHNPGYRVVFEGEGYARPLDGDRR